MRAAARGDVHQQAHAREHHDEAARSVGDERQGHACERRQPEHGARVQERLRDDQRGDANRDQRAVEAARRLRRPQARVGDQPVEEHQRENADDAELLGDHGEDEVRRRLGEVEDLLHRLSRAYSEEPA